MSNRHPRIACVEPHRSVWLGHGRVREAPVPSAGHGLNGANVIADPYGVVGSQPTATLEPLRSIRASAAKLLVEQADELSPATG
jgi:hypothetical protein